MTVLRLCIAAAVVYCLFILLILYVHHKKCKDPKCRVDHFLNWGNKNDRNR